VGRCILPLIDREIGLPQMNIDARKTLPWILAIVFFAIPTLLFFLYPTSFWAVSDNETVGLGNALNMAYRLADREFYPAPGITWHPGVTFYLMNWIALALAGYPSATGGFSFFKTVIAHVEVYHKIIIYLAAFVGASGVYIFARAAQILVPPGVTVIGLMFWLVSTPATIMMFLSPGFESFAILINGLFLAILMRISYERDLTRVSIICAGAIGALAYLNKLSYIYIPVSLGAAIFVKLLLCRTSWIRGSLLIALFVATFASVVLAVAYFVIGWTGFETLLKYHWGIGLGSGLYGTGDQTVVSWEEVRKALAALAINGAYAIPIALISGLALLIGGLAAALKSTNNISVGTLSVGAGSAALLSAIFVVKHYEVHYTAGVSATLPACVVAGYLVARVWGFRGGLRYAAGTAALLACLAYFVMPVLTAYVFRSAQMTKLLRADEQEIAAQIAASKRTVEFTYKAPFAEFGEGFVLVIAEIPRLSEEYLSRSQSTISSFMARRIKPDVGIYVLDKSYFPSDDSIKLATNLDLPASSAPVVIKYEPGDKIIELKTVFLLVRS
jgi:hypothetical protein